MSTITAEEILSQLSDIEDELILKPRKEVASMLGARSEVIESINRDTVIFISGHPRKGLPPFVRFSMHLEKDTYLIMNDPEKLFTVTQVPFNQQQG